MLSEQENIENAMRDLEKTLDLDSFGQVPFKLPQKSASSASIARTSQQPPPEVNRLATGTSKGKEINTTKQLTMTDPQWSRHYVITQIFSEVVRRGKESEVTTNQLLDIESS